MENIEKINKMLQKEDFSPDQIKERFLTVIKEEISHTHKISEFEGDFPTFIEPVYLGENSKIGDDVMLGPNVYIGKNAKIGDYVEISNSVIYANVNIGEDIFLENCIIAEGTELNFSNVRIKNKILLGKARKLDELKQIPLEG